MTTKPVSIRLAVSNGKAVKSEFQQIGAAGAEAMGQIERSSGKMGQGIQNASYQIGDFAVQVAGGTDPMRAMAQQLPQLLGGFGVFGAVAGAAAAIIAPFIGQLFDFADAAEEAEEAMKQLGAAGDTYRQSLTDLQTPMGKMLQDFGSYAIQAREVQQIMVSIARINYFQALADAQSAMSDNLDGMRSYLEEYQAMQAEIDGRYGMEYDAAAAQKDIVAEVREEYGLTVEALEALAAAQDQLAAANGPAEAASAYQAISNAIMDGLEATGSLNPEMAAVAESAAIAAREALAVAAGMEDADNSAGGVASAPIASNIGAGADEAARLAGNLSVALADAAALAAVSRDMKVAGQVSSGRGGDPRTSSQQGYGEFGRQTLDEIIAEERARLARGRPGARGRSGGAGGGGGGADREAVEAQREIERWIKATRTEAEEYAIEMERLNELHSKFGMDAEVYARAVEDLGEKYDEAGGGAKYWADAMQDARGDLLDALAAGESLTDVMDGLAQSIKRAAFEALLFGDGPFGNGGGGLLGGLWDGVQSALTGGVSTVAALGKSTSGAASMAKSGAAQINVTVSGARGNAEIEGMVAQGVRSGLAQYDKHALPRRLKQISADGRRIG